MHWEETKEKQNPENSISSFPGLPLFFFGPPIAALSLDRSPPHLIWDSASDAMPLFPLKWFIFFKFVQGRTHKKTERETRERKPNHNPIIYVFSHQISFLFFLNALITSAGVISSFNGKGEAAKGACRQKLREVRSLVQDAGGH